MKSILKSKMFYEKFNLIRLKFIFELGIANTRKLCLYVGIFLDVDLENYGGRGPPPMPPCAARPSIDARDARIQSIAENQNSH